MRSSPQESELLTRFVVITTQRSGARLLVQALRSHPEVIGFHEVLATGNESPHWFRNHLEMYDHLCTQGSTAGEATTQACLLI